MCISTSIHMLNMTHGQSSLVRLMAAANLPFRLCCWLLLAEGHNHLTPPHQLGTMACVGTTLLMSQVTKQGYPYFKGSCFAQGLGSYERKTAFGVCY